MRQEIGRQREIASEAYDMPSWAYPYRSLAAVESEETPAQFNSRMRAKYEEIQRAKEKREEL